MRIISKLIIIGLIIFSSCTPYRYYYKQNNNHNITGYKTNWTLSFPAGSYSLIEYSSDINFSFYMFTNPEERLLAVFEVEKLSELKDALACREDFIKAPTGTPFFSAAGRYYKIEFGEIPALEYYVSEFEGKPIDQNNITVFFVKDNYSVKLHMSKTACQINDREQLMNLLNSIKFVSNTK